MKNWRKKLIKPKQEHNKPIKTLTKIYIYKITEKRNFIFKNK